MTFETFIGWRYLKAKRKQAFISIITLFSLAGIALGVTTLIVVLAVITGTEEEMKDRILGINAHIVVLRHGDSLDDFRATMREVEAVPGVISVAPFLYSQVIMSGKGGASGAVLRGLDPELAAKDESFLRNLVGGGLAGLDGDGLPGIILGRNLAESLKVDLDDVVRVVVPQGDSVEEGLRSPLVRRFRLAGLMESGMHDFDSTLAYVSLAQAQTILGVGDTVSALEVKVDDVYRSGQIRDAIIARLGLTYWARDWTQMNRNLFAALALQKQVMFIILCLTILVAAFNIVATLIMVVMEKTRDIAILKSMGATPVSIMKIFVFQGLTIGCSGTVLGLLGGLVVSKLLTRYQFIDLPNDVYYLSTIPTRLVFTEVATVAAAAVAISFLATLYPAWQASRFNPVEALRYE
jgi:lipoprotein-releasing system permease protein